MGSQSLLQGIFPTQGSNLHLLCLLHCRQILYHLRHQGSPCHVAKQNKTKTNQKKSILFNSSGTKPPSYFPGGSTGKESACNVGEVGSIPGLRRSPGGGHSNPLQYSCLENPMDREAWRAAVHGVCKESDMTKATKHSTGTKSPTQVEDANFRLCWRFLEHHPMTSPPTNQSRTRLSNFTFFFLSNQ